jgi:hypothetical protein
MQRLDSATLRGKLASGDLTEMATGLAEEILRERERGALEEPGNEVPSVRNDRADDALVDFVREPFGWSWLVWCFVVLFCLLVVASFGTQARQSGDQTFLYGVIMLQSLLLAGIFRAVSSILTSSMSLGILGKLVVIGVFVFAIGGLTMCSVLAQSGWRGG